MTKTVTDLANQRFGKLIVMMRDTREGFVGTHWFCQCDCGRTTTVRAGNLVNGNTISCGCARRSSKRNTNYEKTRPRAGDTRISYDLMLGRCYNPKNHNYERYGALGVSVCLQWRTSYDQFLSDMGERPLGTTLDRYPDPNGNYEPENCRWASPKQQSNNRRDSKVIEAFGQKKTLHEWADEYKLPPSTILSRIEQSKMTPEQALTYKKYQSLSTQALKDKFYRNRKSNVFIEAFGQRKTLVEWSETTGIRAAVISARIRRRGLTPEQALTLPMMPRGKRHKGMLSATD